MFFQRSPCPNGSGDDRLQFVVQKMNLGKSVQAASPGLVTSPWPFRKSSTAFAAIKASPETHANRITLATKTTALSLATTPAD